MSKHTGSKFLLGLSSIAFTFLLCEITVRSLSTSNEDGNQFFASIAIFPLHAPINSATRALSEYRAGVSRFVYDAELGWAMRPSFTTPDGMYSYNSAGIRAPSEVSVAKSSETVRIALFGDSCTHADEVKFEESWGYYLEKELKENGRKVEVLNFGGSGYGMDQAYLHWEKNGKSFKPDFVLFGFQPENVKRNLNLLRPIYTPLNSALPFSKPRFILKDAKLELINSPAVPPDQIPEVVRNIENWNILQYENYYDPFEYRHTLWRESKVVGLVLSATFRSNQYVYDATERSLYSVNQEGGKLALSILEQFKNSVEQNGAKFIVVHLPRPRHVQQIRDGTLNYADLLEALNKSFNLIHTENELLKLPSNGEIERLYGGGLHFTKEGNQYFANVIAEFLSAKAL